MKSIIYLRKASYANQKISMCALIGYSNISVALDAIFAASG